MPFRDLAGQQELRKALLAEIKAGTVSQVTLFTGPAGCGKKSWGTALARVLLCPEGMEHSGGACPSCRRVVSGNHPDFIRLAPAGRWLKIDQIREIRPRLHLARPGGERRVLQICEADRMTPEAASSMLKLLEEPPQNLFIILTSSHPEKLLTTVVSRCRRYALRLLTAAEITLFLESIPILPGVNIDLIARLSQGLPGQALALARDPALEERVKLSVELARGLASTTTGLELLQKAPGLAEREDLLPLLTLIYMYYRDALIWMLSGRSDLLVFPGGCSGLPPVSPGMLVQCLEAVNRVIRAVTFTNAHKQLALEAMIIILRRGFTCA